MILAAYYSTTTYTTYSYSVRAHDLWWALPLLAIAVILAILGILFFARKSRR